MDDIYRYLHGVVRVILLNVNQTITLLAQNSPMPLLYTYDKTKGPYCHRQDPQAPAAPRRASPTPPLGWAPAVPSACVMLPPPAPAPGSFPPPPGTSLSAPPLFPSLTYRSLTLCLYMFVYACLPGTQLALSNRPLSLSYKVMFLCF